MGRGGVVDRHQLVYCNATCGQEVSGAAHHREDTGICGLNQLPNDGDGARVRSRRDGRGKDVEQDVSLLGVEDPEALRDADRLRFRGGIGSDTVLEGGAHTEVGRVGLAEIERSGAVHGVEDGVVDGRVVDLVVDVEGEGLRSLRRLPSSRHNSGQQQQISGEDGECGSGGGAIGDGLHNHVFVIVLK